MPPPINNTRILTVGASRVLHPASGNSSDGGLISIAPRSGTSTSTSPSDDTPTNIRSGMNSVSALSSSEGIHPSSSEELFYWQDNSEPMMLDSDSKVASYVTFANFNENAWRNLKKSSKT